MFKFLFKSSAARLQKPSIYQVLGGLTGQYELLAGRIVGQVEDTIGQKPGAVTVYATKAGHDLLRAETVQHPVSGHFRFNFPIDNAFHPAELATEKVRIVARCAAGGFGTLSLDGAAAIELIRDHMGVPAETLCDIHFSGQGNSRGFTGAGWSGPEEQFCWTEDDDSFVKLPALEQPGRYALRLLAGALVNKPMRPSQDVEFYLNEGYIGEQLYVDGFTQFAEVKFSGDSLVGQPLELRIHHPDATRPCDISTSQDSRRLALSVKRISLVRFL